MRKVIIAAAVAPLMVFGVASCSSSTTTPSESSASPAASASDMMSPSEAMSPGASGATENAAAVAAFCKKADKFAAKVTKWDPPTSAQAAKLAKKSAKLAKSSQGLATAVAAEPELASQVTECAGKVAGSVTPG